RPALPQPRRGRYGRVRGRPGSQGTAGAKRPQGLNDADARRSRPGEPPGPVSLAGGASILGHACHPRGTPRPAAAPGRPQPGCPPQGPPAPPPVPPRPPPPPPPPGRPPRAQPPRARPPGPRPGLPWSALTDRDVLDRNSRYGKQPARRKP